MPLNDEAGLQSMQQQGAMIADEFQLWRILHRGRLGDEIPVD